MPVQDAIRAAAAACAACLAALAPMPAAAAAACAWQGDAPLPAVAATQQRLAADYLAAYPHADFVATVVDGTRTSHLVCGTGITPRTRFEIGSLSKVVTALVLAGAVTEKRVSLDDDVRKYLPPAVAAAPAFAGEPVTLLYLANMTSGLPEDLPARAQPAGTAAQAWQRQAVLEAYTRGDFFRDLREARLQHPPGNDPSHSNVASILLGNLLEDAYQLPYRELVAAQVERPAGMSGAADADAPSLDVRGEAMPRLARVEYNLPAGGLAYTPEDLGRFMHYVIASPSPAVALSLQPTWKTLDGSAAITLGWIWRKTSAAGPHYQASGGTFGFTSHADLYRSCGIGVAFVQNAGDDASQPRLATLADGFAAAIVDGDHRACATR